MGARWSNDASRTTSRLQNELTTNGAGIRKLEFDLSIRQKVTDEFRWRVQELQKSNQNLQRTLDERGKEIGTLQSQLESREASDVVKFLEEANGALREARKLNHDYEARISILSKGISRGAIPYSNGQGRWWGR